MGAAAAVDAADHLPAGIKEIVDGGIEQVPLPFIRPPHDRPQLNLSQVLSSDHNCINNNDDIPIIDLAHLHSPHHRPLLLQSIASACQEWGFFQVINHGVPEEVVHGIKKACHEFFQQPAAVRNTYRSQDVKAPVTYATSFNPAVEKVRDWKDVLWIRDLPEKSCNGFDIAPETCRQAFIDYRPGVERLANQLYQAIFESLGLKTEYLKACLPGLPRVILGVNCYPPCPDPSLTFGNSAHSDINSLTVLLQDEVPGLQIRKGDTWIGVKPLPNAFVINVGDQIQLLSNGRYKSIEHRVVTNPEKMRISVACFLGPREDTKIAPLSNLVSEDEPPLYKEVLFGDYAKNFYGKELLPNRASLDFAKATSAASCDMKTSP